MVFNWESCKRDIRDSLIQETQFKNIVIQIIITVAIFTKGFNLSLSLSIIYYVMLFILGVVLRIAYILFIHMFFPNSSD